MKCGVVEKERECVEGGVPRSTWKTDLVIKNSERDKGREGKGSAYEAMNEWIYYFQAYLAAVSD